MTASVVEVLPLSQGYSGSFAGNVAAGNTVLLAASAFTTSGAAISSSAPLFNGSPVTGAAKLIDVQSAGANAVYAALWILPDVTGGAKPVALTVTGDNTPIAAVGMIALNVAGLGASPSLAAAPSSAIGSGTSVSTGPTGPVTGAGDIVFALEVLFGAALAGAGAPWTEQGLPSSFTMAGWQLPGSSGGTYNYAQSGGSAGWCGAIAAIKGASVSPAPSGLLMASFP